LIPSNAFFANDEARARRLDRPPTSTRSRSRPRAAASTGIHGRQAVLLAFGFVHIDGAPTAVLRSMLRTWKTGSSGIEARRGAMREPSAERENTLAAAVALRVRRETVRVIRVRTGLRTGGSGGDTTGRTTEQAAAAGSG